MDIAALLSGGVDSSVVVHLLCEQGYKPTLFYIKIGMDGAEYMDCSAEEDLEMASAVARRYGLSLEVVDLHREYWDNVAAYAIEKVSRGFTPNPDVMCNKLIKFGCFEQQVGRHFDFTATGHYATTVLQNGKTWLGTALDPVKDQTDFLAQIDYLQVSKLMFPLGGLMKQAQQMQDNMKKMQDSLGSIEVEGQSGAGMVKVTMTCKHDVRRIAIDPSVMDDKEMLEDLVAAAVNDAVRRVESTTQEKMSGFTAGLNLPPGFKMPF